MVHGFPTDKRLDEGSILSIDVGVEYNGWCGDAAWTFPVGMVGRKAQKLLEVGEACLSAAIKKMIPNGSLREISQTIQKTAEAEKFSVVRSFVGHGIGRRMHEPPQVPNYVERSFFRSDIILHPGTVLAIEPMVNMGTSSVEVLEDGWTVVTRDRKLSVHFEHTVAVTDTGCLVLTEWRN